MAVSVLKGDLRPVRAYLEGEMRRAAEALQFETAQRYKSRLAALENYSARSVIVSARIVDVDVFSLVEDDDAAYCNFLRIRNGFDHGRLDRAAHAGRRYRPRANADAGHSARRRADRRRRTGRAK